MLFLPMCAKETHKVHAAPIELQPDMDVPATIAQDPFADDDFFDI